MATTTTNYGFDIPQSTDLVKDGATAIATLGQDIDTAMNTALGTKKAGMVLLNTTSFSAVASTSAPNDTFTSTYDSYRVVLRLSSVSTTTDIRMRYRAAGSDNTTNNYYATWLGVNTVSDATLYMRSGQQTSGYLNTQNTSGAKVWSFDIHNPKLTALTQLFGHHMDNGSLVAYNGGIGFNATTSFDSFSFFTVTGASTMTGDVQVYGYNK